MFTKTGTDMYDLRRLPKSANLVAVLLAFCLCLASFQVMAFLPPTTSPLLTPYINPASPNLTYGSDAAGRIGKDFTKQSSAGANYNRIMRTTASKAAMTAAASKLIRTLPAVGTVLTLAEIAGDLNAVWNKNASGENELQYHKNLTTTHIEYQMYSGSINSAWVLTPEAAVPLYAGVASANGLNTSLDACTGAGSTFKCTFTRTLANGTTYLLGPYGPDRTRVVPNVESTLTPMSEQAVADALAQSARLPKLLAELDPLADALPVGDPRKLPWGIPDVVLPKPFTTSETTIKADGSRCVKSTLNTAIESDADPTAFNKTVSEVCNVPPNTSSNPTSVTQTISSGTTTSEITPSKDFCELHPASIGCLEIDTPDVSTPKSSKAISYASENSFAGGSCPVNKMMSLRGTTLTVFDWADACSKIVSYVKPMFIMMAGFIALLIVAGVKVES
jgi:hypothetical protein